MKTSLDICFSPALYPFYQKENDVVVVVDIFRATTTMCVAFANGAKSIISVADIELAKKYKSDGFLVGAERNARRVDFADFGNSPFEYSPEKVSGKEIVFTTTNGTQAIDVAKNAAHLFIGAFSNIDALVDKCVQSGNRVVILCAGWNNKVNIEDTIFGGFFAEKLSRKADVVFESDAVRMAVEMWKLAKNNPLEYVNNSDHYARLVANGVAGDAEYCFKENTVSVVPRYDKEAKRIIS